MPGVPLQKSGKVCKSIPKEILSEISKELVTAISYSNAKNKGFLPPFILVEYSQSTKKASLAQSFKSLLEDKKPDILQYILYIDPANGYPNSILKNFIGAISANLKENSKTELKFISLRDKIPKEAEKLDLVDSLYFETTISKLPKLEFDTWIMKDPSTFMEWNIDLKQIMDRGLYF